MAQEARGWALVRLKQPMQAAAAFDSLQPLAVRQQWDAQWYIKRIDVVTSMKEFPPKDPHAAFSMVVAVKAKDRGQLVIGLQTIDKTLHTAGFSEVEAYEVGAKFYSFNWP